jgi:hypothetical protein
MEKFWKLLEKVYDGDYLNSATKTKASIVEKTLDSVNFTPKTVFFVSYNPVADLLADSYDVFLTPDDMSLAKNPKIKSSEGIGKFDCVIALDEHLTYFADESGQRIELERLAKLCSGWLITTLVDYKNLAPYKKNQVEVIHDYKSDAIFLEHNSPISTDKQAWNSYFYAITDHRDLEIIGPFARRTMYFKQLAKYASDAGSLNYIIQKNTLYKGFGRKHWEHIITIRF